MNLSPSLASTVLLSPGEGDVVHALGNTMTIKAAAAQTAGALGAFECTIPAGAPGPPEHVHVTFDEAFYVLEGDLALQVEGDTTPLSPGAFAFIPRGTRHTFSNPSATPIRFLVLCTPGGFEGFFGAIASAGEPDFAAIDAIAARHDSITVA